MKGGKVPVEILVRGKDAEENKKQFQICIETMKKAGKKTAVLKKDNATGPFADEWKAALQEAGFKEEDQVELGPILSQAALAIKDEKELVSPCEPNHEPSLNHSSEPFEMRRAHPAPS